MANIDKWMSVSISSIEKIFDKNVTDLSKFMGLDISTTKYIYVNCIGNKKIFRFDLDGTNQTTIVDKSGSSYTLFCVAADVTNNKIYYVLNSSPTYARIYYADLDDGGNETLLFTSTQSTIRSLYADVDNNHLYFTETNLSTNAWIRRIDLDDGSNDTLLVTQNRVEGVTVDADAGYIFFSDVQNDDLYRCDLDGSNIISLYSSGMIFPIGVTYDPSNSYVYGVDYNGQFMYRTNYDGTGDTTLLSSISGPTGIALDLTNSYIIWCSYSANQIRRCSLTGSGDTALISSGITNPRDIIIA